MEGGFSREWKRSEGERVRRKRAGSRRVYVKLQKEEGECVTKTKYG